MTAEEVLPIHERGLTDGPAASPPCPAGVRARPVRLIDELGRSDADQIQLFDGLCVIFEGEVIRWDL
ncbi:hypothetical protein [Actinomadura sp. RB99]|uniref:hypothetical protein n=1 Tax=Actinomadura sp. RB99 TaxID=2691577 RepID=UPI001688F81C|nr:hypothetical protein [Actinomadura sp. RB99]